MNAIAPEILDALKSVSSATATMWLLKNHGIRRAAMEGVQPIVPAAERLVGEAFTLRFLPMREDLSTPAVLGAEDYAPRAAIEQCPAGAFLTIDARGVTESGIVGDILAMRLAQRGVLGVVTDGAVRDVDGCAAVGLPIWAAGVAAPASIHAHAGGDLQRPIGCGEVAVIPGDILIADNDGVVVVPRALAADLAKGGAEQERFEAWVLKQVRAGRSTIGLYPPNPETRAEYEAEL